MQLEEQSSPKSDPSGEEDRKSLLTDPEQTEKLPSLLFAPNTLLYYGFCPFPKG